MLSGSTSRGFSLVMVLILLGALALASAHTLKSASGSEKVATSFRMQALALQSAEQALRYCEAQLLLSDAQRVGVLRDAALPVTTAAAPAWTRAALWSSGALASPAVGAGTPSPVCMAEKQTVSSGQVHVVTARGLSPDWRGDTAAATLGGSAVWLQSIVLIQADSVRERVQRRILQPPLR